MKYCCMTGLVLLAATNLVMMDKIQKWACRIVGPSPAALFEPLACSCNVASISLFYRRYFGRRCSYELAELVSLPYSSWRSSCYSNSLHEFSVTICRCYRDVPGNSFFPCTARLWNLLSAKCFPLTYLKGC